MAKPKPAPKPPPKSKSQSQSLALAKPQPRILPGPEYWRDPVGRSGVYPMSGPMPAGDAPVRGQMEFGQGERGAAGYYDAGGSELVYTGGQLLGGLSAGPGGAPEGSAAPTAARPGPAHRGKPKRKPAPAPRRKAA